jgi:hypothetical protein
MESEVIKTNLLAIAVSGFLTMLAGVILYFFRSSISTNIRYLLQVPPLGVAAYIFSFNLFRGYVCAHYWLHRSAGMIHSLFEISR